MRGIGVVICLTFLLSGCTQWQNAVSDWLRPEPPKKEEPKVDPHLKDFVVQPPNSADEYDSEKLLQNFFPGAKLKSLKFDPSEPRRYFDTFFHAVVLNEDTEADWAHLFKNEDGRKEAWMTPEGKIFELMDFSPLKCPIAFVKNPEAGEIQVLFNKNKFEERSCKEVFTNSVWFKRYRQYYREYTTEHPELPECSSLKNFPNKNCKATCNPPTSLDSPFYPPYNTQFCKQFPQIYVCFSQTRKQKIQAEKDAAEAQEWLEQYQREEARKRKADPLYEFYIEKNNRQRLKCGRATPEDDITCRPE